MEQSTLAIIIVLLAIVSFALEKIPVALTAILASLAMAIFGITDYSKAFFCQHSFRIRQLWP